MFVNISTNYMIPQVALVNPALGNYMSHPLDIDT